MDVRRLLRKVHPLAARGKVLEVERLLAEALARLPPTRYHSLLGMWFENEPKEVAGHIDAFVDKQRRRGRGGFEPRAVYLEMNGFDINTDLWFFDLFAYPEAPPARLPDDWLVGWKSRPVRGVTLVGMEYQQAVYAHVQKARDAVSRRRLPWKEHHRRFLADERWGERTGVEPARMLSVYLVQAKFQRLVASALPHLKRYVGPVLATAHDSDLLYVGRSRRAPRPQPFSETLAAALPRPL